MTKRRSNHNKPSQRPRYRYIAFRVEGLAGETGFKRHDVINAVQKTFENEEAQRAQPWLTRFNGEYGILRVRRGTETHAAEILLGLKPIVHQGQEISVRVTTLSTSGTIASLNRKALRGVRLDA